MTDRYRASPRTLNVLAALVWYIGGLVLLWKGATLLTDAEALSPGHPWPWLGTAVGLIAGALQARYLFARNCRKNLDRIANLERPRLWEFFRPGFFVALGAMIATGASLSRLAQGSYAFLIVVGSVDIALAVSLLGSSVVFWQRRAFVR